MFLFRSLRKGLKDWKKIADEMEHTPQSMNSMKKQWRSAETLLPSMGRWCCLRTIVPSILQIKQIWLRINITLRLFLWIYSGLKLDCCCLDLPSLVCWHTVTLEWLDKINCLDKFLMMGRTVSIAYFQKKWLVLSHSTSYRSRKLYLVLRWFELCTQQNFYMVVLFFLNQWLY